MTYARGSLYAYTSTNWLDFPSLYGVKYYFFFRDYKIVFVSGSRNTRSRFSLDKEIGCYSLNSYLVCLLFYSVLLSQCSHNLKN